MKRKILAIISIVVFLAGVLVLLYPSIAKDINNHKTDSVVEDFNKTFELLNEQNADTNSKSSNDQSSLNNSNKNTDNNTGESYSTSKYYLDPQLIAKLYDDLQAYNLDLAENGQSSYGNPFIFEDAGVDLSAYGITNGQIGYISIPAIEMNLPIYLGANDYNMAIGAAHMNRTSLPIGGESTNCAIAGHRGMINKVMFDNIVYLSEGDDVYIVNYWDTLHYKVRETRIINPSASNEILIEKGEDLVSLITCHPYGSNAQRFLVICERVK